MEVQKRWGDCWDGVDRYGVDLVSVACLRCCYGDGVCTWKWRGLKLNCSATCKHERIEAQNRPDLGSAEWPTISIQDVRRQYGRTSRSRMLQSAFSSSRTPALIAMITMKSLTVYRNHQAPWLERPWNYSMTPSRMKRS